eukprot:1876963-Amphidinium_carterae.3
MDWHLMRRLNLEDCWYCKWYNVVATDTPCLHAVPHTVPLTASNIALERLWPVQRKTKVAKAGDVGSTVTEGHPAPFSGWGSVTDAATSVEVMPSTSGAPEPDEAYTDLLDHEEESEAWEWSDEETFRVLDLVLDDDVAVGIIEPPLGGEEAFGSTDLSHSLHVAPVVAEASASSSVGQRTRKVAAGFASGPKTVAQASLEFPDKQGKLAFHVSKAAFEAHCPHHHRCVLSRTAKPRQTRLGASTCSQGRPLGMMTAWLLYGKGCTKEEHWDKTRWFTELSFEKRSSARTYLEGLPGAAALLECERAREGDEGLEPEFSLGLF